MKAQPPHKSVLFIIGMHRSGTSAMAGSVHFSGISGGGQLISPSFDNVKGFYENQSVLKINEDILEALDRTWDSPFDLPDHWVFDSKLEKHRNVIRHFLSTELGSRRAIYIKDPRLSFLLPLWQNVLAEMDIQQQFIVMLRPPEEVYQSLRRRNDLPRNKALSMWLAHLLMAEKNTREHPRLFVQYSELLEDPVQQVEFILDKFQLRKTDDAWETNRKLIKDFIDKQLKHHAAKQTDFGEAEIPYYAVVYHCLKKLVKSPNDAEALAKIDELRAMFRFNQSFFVPTEKKACFATLKVESRMAAPLKVPVFSGLEGLVFQVDQLVAPAQTFQIFPCNEVCKVVFRQAKVRYSDGSSEVLESVGKKVLLEHGDEYFFAEGDYLLVNPNWAKKAVSILLDMQFEAIGKEAIASIADVGDRKTAWFFEKLQEKEAAAQNLTAELSEKVATKESELNRLAEKMTAKDSELTEQSQQLLAKDEELAKLAQSTEAEREALAGQIRDLEEKIQQAEQGLAAKTAAWNESQSLNQNLQRTIESLRQDLAAAQAKQRKNGQLLWEMYAQKQKLESDYSGSLGTLADVRASISYRVGWVLTWPLRTVYDLFSRKPVNETKLWLFFQFLGAGLKMPGRMMANINGKNIGTLRKALRNESPSQIVGNLFKLLRGESAAPAKPGAHEPGRLKAPAAPAIALPSGVKQLSESLPVSLENDRTETPTLDLALARKHKKVVLFASPFLPDFDESSGGKRATRMLGLLAEDYDVYAFTLGNRPEKHIKKLESLGVKVFRGDDFAVVQRLVPRVDVLVFSFFYTYFDCGKFIAMYPTAKVIVDSVDVHWVRHERSRGMWKELTDDVIAKKKALEIEVYEKAAIVWAVTEEDRRAILSEVPDADVRIVSNVHRPVVTEYQDPGNHNLLFFGGFAHYPNIIAVKELVKNVFPKIRAQMPEARLLIAGSHAPSDVVELGKLPGVEFLGFIEDGAILDLYKNTFLALAPLQAGAGIKGKICEAISYMVPVVTNSIGNEGISLVNEAGGLVSDDTEALVRMTVKALRREYDLAKMTQVAQSRLYDLVGPATVKKSMVGSFFVPEISICIVTWNKLELLQRCIESIESHTHGIKYKILVHSNGCKDGTQKYLTAAAKINPNIVPILSQTNDVFVLPNNRMMELFPENDVVLLNNDTYVTDGWLTALRDAAYSSDEIGITGAKILYPDGRLQEFGSELYADGTGRNIGKFDDADKAEYQHAKYAGYVSGCAFYIKRSTILEIGTFDEAFHPCYCEDSDYCYTAWEHGIATLVTPDCVIYHDEGSTSGTDTNTGFKAYQKVNFEKFLKKHAARLDETATKIKLMNLALKAEYV